MLNNIDRQVNIMDNVHFQLISTQPLTPEWSQLSLRIPEMVDIALGTRFHIDNMTCAPWRIQGQQIDCLYMGTIDELSSIKSNTLHRHTPTQPRNPYQATLVIGEDLGIADCLMYCQHVKQSDCLQQDWPLILLKAESFPCMLKPARFMVNTFPQAIAACPLLEDWGFANRLLHDTLPGCLDMSVTEVIQQQTMARILYINNTECQQFTIASQ